MNVLLSRLRGGRWYRSRLAGVVLLLAGALTSIVFGSTAALATSTTYFYVSPTGSDTTGSGTLASPWQHILKAQQAVRALIPTLSGNVNVYLEGGTYPICSGTLCPSGSEAPLTFTSADSAPAGYLIQYLNYNAVKPVLSGGYPLTGWTQTPSSVAGNFWQAPVPAGFNTRDLYVNGVRAQRGTTMGGFQPDAVTGSLMPPYYMTQTSTGYVVSDQRPSQWYDPTHVQFVYTGVGANNTDGWSQARCNVASVVWDAVVRASTITMAQPCYNIATGASAGGRPSNPTSSFKVNMPTAIEGIIFGSDYRTELRPGQWFLDRIDNLIFYVPLNGQVMSGTGAVSAVAGVTQTLLSLAGTTSANVANLSFNGLTFKNTTWLQPDTTTGFVDDQANEYYTDTSGSITFPAGAIDVQNSNHIIFDSDVMTDLGGTSVWMHNASQNIQLSHSEISYTGANGVQIGDQSLKDPTSNAQKDLNDMVSYNKVHDVAQVFQGGIGIWAGYVTGLSVVFNTVYNTPYTGISVGWGWGNPADPLATGNQGSNYISQNNVYNFEQMGSNGLLDGGGIYTSGNNWGSSTQSVIQNNYIHDGGSEIGSVYADSGADYWVVTNNVIGNNQATWWATFSATHNSAYTNYTDATADRTQGAGFSGNFASQPNNPWTGTAATIIAGAGCGC